MPNRKKSHLSRMTSAARRARKKRLQETSVQRLRRLETQRLHAAFRRANETEEERYIRLLRCRLRTQQKREYIMYKSNRETKKENINRVQRPARTAANRASRRSARTHNTKFSTEKQVHKSKQNKISLESEHREFETVLILSNTKFLNEDTNLLIEEHDIKIEEDGIAIKTEPEIL